MTTRKRNRKGGEYVGPYELKDGTRQYRIVYRIKDPVTGVSRQTQKRGFRTEKEATSALQQLQEAQRSGNFVKQDKQSLEAYATEWLDGHRAKPSTLESYRKNLRLHVFPTLGKVPLQQVTSTQIDALYKRLEVSGRADGKGGLSPTTVRYVHVILRELLARAVHDRRLSFNPADRAHPPTIKNVKAAAPERTIWTAEQISRFLSAQREHRLYALWVVYTTTGMRRGEALALRWKDVDLDGKRATVARTVGKVAGKVTTGTPKGGKARVVDLDAATVEVLRSHKARQAAERLSLGDRWVDQGLVFAHDGNKLGPEGRAGGFLNPEHVWRLLQTQIAAYNTSAEPDLALPVITVHELRHSWATMAMLHGISPKVVQERLGHSTVSITLDLYSHVSPGMQQDAATKVAAGLL